MEQAFLEQFDNYVELRAQLRNAPDGSDDERYCIANCADQWNRLVESRAALTRSEALNK